MPEEPTTQPMTGSEKDWTEWETLIKSRRAIRRFAPTPISDDLLRRLLDAARWAPSGYNLQPTHFVVVTDTAVREKLCPACFGQRQVRDAPVVVVFTGDRNVVQNNLDQVIEEERRAGALSEAYEPMLRRFIKLGFDTGPAGLGWLWKALATPVVRLFRPAPELPAVHRRYWVTKQVMLSAMVFMLAAEAAGLSTVPMEGFDEARVRRILGIPKSHIVGLVVPVGYAADTNLKKSRLPLDSMIHLNGW